MQLIREEKLNRKIKKEFRWSFEIKRAGFYGIEVTASAKSWWQNFLKLRSFLKDDDLTLKIDNLSFPKKSGKRGLFDSEVAWNGNNLRGLKKTNFFLIKLNQGNHNLTFFADQTPKIETIRIFKIEKDEISYLPKDNYPIQEGNRRQWLTIILCNLGLQSLKIKASAKQGKTFSFFQKDDSDLKLIINDQIQNNQEPKSHGYWYWCGRTLKGNSKTFEKELNLKPDLHYVEFWADRNPDVEEIKFTFSESILFSLRDVQTYTYKGVKSDENYDRFDEPILDAVNEWNRHFFSQEEPPPGPLHPNLVKAMIYVESRMGYYQAGEGYYPAYPDVMQVADPRNPAIHTLNNDGWIDPATGQVAREYEWIDGKEKVMNYHDEANGDTMRESIRWGIRWLYHKAQRLINARDGGVRRTWKSWEEALEGYNPKPHYTKDVIRIYKEGVDPKGNILWKKQNSRTSSLKLSSFLIIVGLSASTIFSLMSLNFFRSNQTRVAPIQPSITEQFYKDLENYKKRGGYYYGDIFKHTLEACHNSGCDSQLTFYNHLDELVRFMSNNQQFIESALSLGLLLSGAWEHYDIDNDGKNEIIFLWPDFLNREFLKLGVIDERDGHFGLIEKMLDESYFNSPDSIFISARPLKIIDVTGDGAPEILIFANQGRYGANLHLLRYSNSEIKEMSVIDDFVYPTYTFFDQDKDGVLEIKVAGEEPCAHSALWPECYDMPKEGIFKYDVKADVFETVEK